MILGYGNVKGFVIERLDWNFFLEILDYDRILINNKIEIKYFVLVFGL